MSVEIKLLSSKDKALLKEAWEWADSAPKWFRESLSTWKESFREFIKGADNELIYGIFIEGELSAVIRLIPDNNMLLDAHLYAKRKTPFDVLLQAAMSIKEWVFDNTDFSIYGWICRKNRSVIRLYKELGFVHNGATETKGEYYGRPIEWLNMVCFNDRAKTN